MLKQQLAIDSGLNKWGMTMASSERLNDVSPVKKKYIMIKFQIWGN